MIELREVYKSFSSRQVLKGVSFSVKKGETFVIIGMSGTGKTVCLKHISGLIDPDAGEVLISGEKINDSSLETKERLRRKMGVVFQSGALINWLSVKENVALPLKEEKKFSLEEIDQIVDDKLRLLRLSDAKDKMPSNISGGMKKRAGLARVLVRNPEIILYDEPTSGLDPVMSTIISDLVRQMQADFGVTSIVVTHDMNSAYHIADRIAVLYEGEIIQCDVPEVIKESSNPIVRQFVRGMISGPIKVK